MIDNKNNNCNP